MFMQEPIRFNYDDIERMAGVKLCYSESVKQIKLLFKDMKINYFCYYTSIK